MAGSNIMDPKTPSHLKTICDATYQAIDQVCEEVGEFLHAHGLDDHAFDVLLGIREALTNAVRHGSKLNPSAKITLQVSFADGRLRLQIADQGPGFDWRAAMARKIDPEATSGRGLYIIRHYFDQTQFNENGNELELVKTMMSTQHGRESMSAVSTAEGLTTVKPGGDIVASMVNEFKAELKMIVDGGVNRLAVDLAEVKMIDSMGLGLLIATHNSLKKKAGQLELNNVSPDILKLLKNMRLDQHFKIQST